MAHVNDISNVGISDLACRNLVMGIHQESTRLDVGIHELNYRKELGIGARWSQLQFDAPIYSGTSDIGGENYRGSKDEEVFAPTRAKRRKI